MAIAQAKFCIFTKILHIALYLVQINHMRFLLVFKLLSQSVLFSDDQQIVKGADGK